MKSSIVKSNVIEAKPIKSSIVKSNVIGAKPIKSGGVSLTGAYHAINQDCYTVRAVRGGHILVVSDGLGSLRQSQAGSAAICSAACNIADARECSIDETFLAEVHAEWLDILEQNKLDVKDCCATALIALVTRDEIRAFRLGDGFIGIVADGEVTVLFDQKEDEFVNVTDCLDGTFDLARWQSVRLARKNFVGLVAATDGITLVPEEKNLKRFVKDFCTANRDEDAATILADIKRWISKFIGTDDATLAFLLEEASDIEGQ